MKRRTVLAATALCLLLWAAPGAAATSALPKSAAASTGASPKRDPGLDAGPRHVSTPAPRPTPAAGAPKRAAWTFAVYANEDNDLEYTWQQFTLRALRALPANAAVNVVVMVDWRSAGKGVQLLRFSAAG